LEHIDRPLSEAAKGHINEDSNQQRTAIASNKKMKCYLNAFLKVTREFFLAVHINQVAYKGAYISCNSPAQIASPIEGRSSS
jgi:protein-L-isoaspartate O-methyltransferase